MTSAPLFDRALVGRHIARAKHRFAEHSALFNDTASQLEERLSEVLRPFQKALDLSPFPFLVAREDRHVTGTALDEPPNAENPPFTRESFDLIVSNLGLHWINDLPNLLARVRTTLKPGGLFLAAFLGERTLSELRACLIDAEIAVTGGVSPRVSPMISLQDASQLMVRAGFTLPVADRETVTLLYEDMFALMRDLRGMGQTNAMTERLRRPTRRAVFEEAARLYQERFMNEDGLLPATFDVIYLHGWGKD